MVMCVCRVLVQARGRELGPSQIIQVQHRFNDLKPFVWTGAVSPSAYKTSLDRAVVELKTSAPDDMALAMTGDIVSSGGSAGAGSGTSESTPGVSSGGGPTVVSPMLEEILCCVPSVEVARTGLGVSVMESRAGPAIGKDLVAPIHPVGSLNLDLFGMSGSDGVEKGVEVLPEDSPALYDELVALVKSRPVLAEKLSATLAALEPDTRFPNGKRIFKKECHNYGKELVNVLKSIWMLDSAAAAEVCG